LKTEKSSTRSLENQKFKGFSIMKVMKEKEVPRERGTLCNLKGPKDEKWLGLI